VDEIFEDLTTEHPFLASIGMRTTGLRTKFLKSETSGLAVWGKIFGEIKGQLDATFSEEESIQNKLTAFVVVPKDLENFGPVWVKRFVVTQIEEAFAVALESAFIIGDGKDKPVGLTRKVGKG
ncbi:TPA: phage major capsid protein, partial [Listeria monocytogenes]|nr:phage major capsid protein [Listeria monocytogenes]HAM1650304.1 phage major capsid protein [Listeria monocytogenes]